MVDPRGATAFLRSDRPPRPRPCHGRHAILKPSSSSPPGSTGCDDPCDGLGRDLTVETGGPPRSGGHRHRPGADGGRRVRPRVVWPTRFLSRGQARSMSCVHRVHCSMTVSVLPGSTVTATRVHAIHSAASHPRVRRRSLALPAQVGRDASFPLSPATPRRHRLRCKVAGPALVVAPGFRFDRRAEEPGGGVSASVGASHPGAEPFSASLGSSSPLIAPGGRFLRPQNLGGREGSGIPNLCRRVRTLGDDPRPVRAELGGRGRIGLPRQGEPLRMAKGVDISPFPPRRSFRVPSSEAGATGTSPRRHSWCGTSTVGPNSNRSNVSRGRSASAPASTDSPRARSAARRSRARSHPHPDRISRAAISP